MTTLNKAKKSLGCAATRAPLGNATPILNGRLIHPARLLATTALCTVLALQALPALANGGQGGGPGGGAGGLNSVSGAGGAGGNGVGTDDGGGGGGSGNNANPFNDFGGAGGAGGGGATGGAGATQFTNGSGPFVNGGNGTNGASPGHGGGGGGGGTAFLYVGSGTPSVVLPSSAISASSGGNGGNGNGSGSGGGGGAGGTTVLFVGTPEYLDVSAGATVTGGTAGNGGTSGTGQGGSGGRGGNAIDMRPGATGNVGLGLDGITIGTGATIQGGNGGNGGIGGSITGSAGVGGDGIITNNTTIRIGSGALVAGGNAGSISGSLVSGGFGILGSNLTIINNGTIRSGLNSGGVLGFSLGFTGGTNTLRVGTGSSVEGTILVGPGSLLQIDPLGGSRTMDSGFLNQGNLQFLAGTTILTSSSTTGSPGTVTIDSGATLQLGNGGTSGSLPTSGITNNGVLAINRSDSVTVSDAISGTGSVRKQGAGGLLISGVNSYAGGTDIQQGSVFVSNNAALGTGGVTMATGTRLGAFFDTTLSNNVTLNGSGTFEANAGSVLTLAGSISGGQPAAFNGQIVVTGNNSFSTATISTGSTLRVGNGGSSGTLGTGNVTNNGQLIFNRSGTVTVAGGISGTGTLTQAGTGRTVLNGVNSYSGATTVSAGTLIVNGSLLNSITTVGSSATLGGTGTVGALTVNGTLSPGNSPGTLNVVGPLTFTPGSVYLAEVQGGVADRINVTGTADLAGTLRLAPLGGPYTFGTSYTLLSASGGRTGTFGTVDTLGTFGAGVTTSVTYDPTSVFLTLSAAPLTSILITGRPTNAASVSAGIDRAVTAGGDASPFFPLYNLSLGALPAGLLSVDGEVHTAASGAVQSASSRFLSTLLDPLGNGRLAQCERAAPNAGQAKAPAGCGSPLGIASVWGASYAGSRHVSGSGVTGAASRRDQLWGLAMGIDIRVDNQTIVGLAVSGGQANASLGSGRGTANTDLGQVGLYGFTTRGAFTFAGALAYSHGRARTSRSATLFNTNGLKSRPDVDGLSGRIEAAYRFLEWQGLAFSGTAAFQGHTIRREGSNERVVGGTNPAALTVTGNTAVTARTELGLRTDYTRGALSAYTRFAWAHYQARDSEVNAAFQALAGSNFVANGAQVSRNAALIGAGLSMTLPNGWTVGGQFDGEFAHRVRGVSGNLNATYRF